MSKRELTEIEKINEANHKIGIYQRKVNYYEDQIKQNPSFAKMFDVYLISAKKDLEKWTKKKESICLDETKLGEIA